MESNALYTVALSVRLESSSGLQGAGCIVWINIMFNTQQPRAAQRLWHVWKDINRPLHRVCDCPTNTVDDQHCLTSKVVLIANIMQCQVGTEEKGCNRAVGHWQVAVLSQDQCVPHCVM